MNILRVDFLWVFILASCAMLCSAQSVVQPKVGEPIPDYEFATVKNYKKKSASFRDFRGKWLIVELWYSGCRMCIESLPRMNQLKKEIGDDVQVLLIGCTHPEICFGDGLEETYDRLALKMGLDLSIAFDRDIVSDWSQYTMPKVFIVDPMGTIRVETDGRDLTADKMKRLMGGEQVPFYLGRNIKTISDSRKTIAKFEICEWAGDSVVDDFAERQRFTGKVMLSGIPLFQLFNLAYAGKNSWFSSIDSLYGKMAFTPANETKKKDLFEHMYETGKGFVNYELNLGDRLMTRAEVLKVIQNDLSRAFDVNVSIEKRMSPVWTLVATPDGRRRLKSKHVDVYYSDKTASGGAGGFTLHKGDMKFLMALITKYINNYDYPYLDETGISGNIDITIDALLLDFDQVRKELRRNGLDLVLDQREMDTIVVRDCP